MLLRACNGCQKLHRDCAGVGWGVVQGVVVEVACRGEVCVGLTQAETGCGSMPTCVAPGGACLHGKIGCHGEPLQAPRGSLGVPVLFGSISGDLGVGFVTRIFHPCVCWEAPVRARMVHAASLHSGYGSSGVSPGAGRCLGVGLDVHRCCGGSMRRYQDGGARSTSRFFLGNVSWGVEDSLAR